MRMYIDKFDSVVEITESHPLAIAQREKDAAEGTDRSAPNEPPAPSEPNNARTGYGRMNKPDLVALATERGLDAKGTKPEIVERLEDADAEPDGVEGDNEEIDPESLG